MGEWREVELSAIAEVQTGPFGSQLHAADYVPVGVPVIMPNNIGQRLTLNEANMSFITEADATRLSRYKVKEGDIVFSRRGDVDKCILIDKRKADWFCGTGCLFARINSSDADPEFVAYQFDGPELKNWLRTNAVGTTMPNLNSTILSGAPVALPDLPEQRAIASVLSSLDAKIDLLHRQNKTLEAMAEALFRQWFVEQAEEGWEEYVLTDVADHIKDSVNPGQHPDRTYHHYSLPAFDEGRKPSPELGDTIKSSKYVVPENAVLVSKLNPRFPRVWPVREKKHEDPISSTEFQVFVPKQAETFGFLYCFLNSKTVQDELASAASGTSGSHQRVSPDDIKALTFQAKSKQRLADFSKVVDPMLEKIETNKDQVANLTKLRDTLLPKLMSGEVRVDHGYATL